MLPLTHSKYLPGWIRAYTGSEILFCFLLKKYLLGSYHLLSTVDAMVTKISMIPALYCIRGKQIVMPLNIKLLMRKQRWRESREFCKSICWGEDCLVSEVKGYLKYLIVFERRVTELVHVLADGNSLCKGPLWEFWKENSGSQWDWNSDLCPCQWWLKLSGLVSGQMPNCPNSSLSTDVCGSMRILSRL